MAGDGRVGGQVAGVKLGIGIVHDGCVHAVLDRQSPGHGRAVKADNPFHQTDGQAPFGRFGGEDRRRQLAVIAGQDDPVCPQEREPAGRFGRLAGLVDDGQVEPSRTEDVRRAKWSGVSAITGMSLIQHYV